MTMKRTPIFLLGEARPSVFAWVQMAARMEACCGYDHTRRSRDGDHLCPRCNTLFAQALILSAMTGTVPALVVLDRLLDALEGTGEKAA